MKITFEIKLMPLEVSCKLYNFTCPSCHTGKIWFEDGDSIYINKNDLPDGVPSYEHMDAELVVGTCQNRDCRKKSYICEFSFSTLPDPAGESWFGLVAEKSTIVYFQAANQFGETWIVERNTWADGILPQGKCVVDRHVFGPYLLRDHNKVISPHIGVTRCGQSNEIWLSATILAYKISSNAMKLVLAAR